ncbi:hypothetical protein FOA43_003493 [Brettanomyces nanus]|uniref:Uncharacterized protein n=1 Tax=Eeniella nana TaxID=13502 RepID=A0A875RW68_EENNA|nr:uncharacterized protein FOA43_003493 [Brettanomyces nanus]QPG76107.1 hypothetical protein FOA43_003493 [Brettanomyces nanus]
MGLLSSSKRDIAVSFAYSIPEYRCFGPFDPNVKGTVEVKFLRKVKKILNIRVGLSGTVDGTFIHAYKTDANSDYGSGNTKRETFKDSTMLFDIGKYLSGHDSSESTIAGDFETGAVIKNEFDFRFPFEGTYLPSSCVNIGGSNDNQGIVSVIYKLYVTVTHRKEYRKMNYVQEFPEVVAYQADSMLPVTGSVTYKEYNICNIFRAKVKKFVFDPRLNMLVPSSLEKAHRRTRIIRSIWNDNYRKDIYSSLTKDISIFCVLHIPDAINIMHTFNQIIKLKIRVKLDVPMEPNFCFNNQSTGLGVFDIEQIGLYQIYDVNMKIQQYTDSHRDKLPLMLMTFKPGTLRFDIKDFIHNGTLDVWEHEISLDSFSRATASPVLYNFPIPTMMYGSVGDHFKCASTAEFEVVIGNANEREPKRKTFTALTHSMFHMGYQLAHHNAVEVEPVHNIEEPPPSYFKHDFTDLSGEVATSSGPASVPSRDYPK